MKKVMVMAMALLFACTSPVLAGVVTVDQLEVVPSSTTIFYGEPVDAMLYANAQVADENADVLDLGTFHQFSFEVCRLTEKGEEFIASKKFSRADFPHEVTKGRTVVAHALDVAQSEPLKEGTYLLKFVASSPGESAYVKTANFKVYQATLVQAAKLL